MLLGSNRCCLDESTVAFASTHACCVTWLQLLLREAFGPVQSFNSVTLWLSQKIVCYTLHQGSHQPGSCEESLLFSSNNFFLTCIDYSWKPQPVLGSVCHVWSSSNAQPCQQQTVVKCYNQLWHEWAAITDDKDTCQESSEATECSKFFVSWFLALCFCQIWSRCFVTGGQHDSMPRQVSLCQIGAVISYGWMIGALTVCFTMFLSPSE